MGSGEFEVLAEDHDLKLDQVCPPVLLGRISMRAALPFQVEVGAIFATKPKTELKRLSSKRVVDLAVHACAGSLRALQERPTAHHVAGGELGLVDPNDGNAASGGGNCNPLTIETIEDSTT